MDHFFYKGLKTEGNRRILKVNILPEKTCNFDCIFCPIGRARKGDSMLSFGSLAAPLAELAKEMELTGADTVFLNSSGEALLHQGIGEIINFIHSKGRAVRLLTNGYLLGREPFAKIARRCEEIFCEIKVITEEDFQKAQRPVDGYTLAEYIANMEAFRRGFQGGVIFEVTIIKGYNDSDSAVQKLQDVVRRLSPTVLRIARMDEEPFRKTLDITDERFAEISAQLRAAL
ncbi:MAG: radical SAM protein [Oscillospiraceae bacterium]|nr:radical SAM protein [Oscillospiraceae bacterium]